MTRICTWLLHKVSLIIYYVDWNLGLIFPFCHHQDNIFRIIQINLILKMRSLKRAAGASGFIIVRFVVTLGICYTYPLVEHKAFATFSIGILVILHPLHHVLEYPKRKRYFRF